MEEMFISFATVYAKVWTTEKITNPMSDGLREIAKNNEHIHPVRHALTMGLWFGVKAIKYYSIYLIISKKL